jgi:hypothetical protein
MTQEENNEEPIDSSTNPPSQPAKPEEPKENPESPKTPKKEKSPAVKKSESKKQKPRTTWEKISANLPGQTLQAMQTLATDPDLSNEELEYQAVRAAMPADSQDILDAIVEMPPEEESLAVPKYCLVETPEGEFPRVKLFTGIEAMSRYLGSIEGKEIAVWPFFGVPLWLTKSDSKSKVRYVLLPGNEEAAAIPNTKREPFEIIEAELIDHLEYQEDGWIGDPALAEGVSDSFYDRGRVAKDIEDTDEFEEEEGEPVS